MLGSVFTDWTVMNFLWSVSLYSLLLPDDRPASVHMMNSSISIRSPIIFSVGSSVFCSFVLPGFMLNASGSPSASMKTPICTIGVRLFSFDAPGRLRTVSRVDS